MNAVLAIIADGGRVIVVNLQADRGCAAVAFFWGGLGAFGKKGVTLRGLRISEKKEILRKLTVFEVCDDGQGNLAISNLLA